MSKLNQSFLPIFCVVFVIVILWYFMSFFLNSDWAFDRAGREGRELTFSSLVADTLSQEKPRLPAPHQLAVELWNTTVEKSITSKRSLIFHSGITLISTLLGFAFGVVLGVFLAVLIVYFRTVDMSVMPWVIASQTIPLLAIAPMIIVVLNSVGLSGLVPKAIISMYLSFFPVVVGMVKGLRSPDRMQLDQMRTWNSSSFDIFWRLRLPHSMPYFFTSMKVAVAAALVGAIVGELPTGAVAGLGARLLAGSYYGQTIQIWSALFMAATLAAILVGCIGLLQRLMQGKMGIVS